MSEKGFIYVMSNPSFMHGLIKIGKSAKHPESFRKSELQTTGVPEPFVVEYSALVTNFSQIELEAHKVLKKYRHRTNREFFDLPLPDAIAKVRELASKKLLFEEFSDSARMAIDLEGEIVKKHSNGEPKTVKRFRDGGYSFTFEEYFSNGKKKSRTNFCEGKENGMRKEWKSNGSRKKLGLMYNGYRQGKWNYFQKFGVETKYFDEGKPVLTWEIFDNQGKLTTIKHGSPAEGYEEKVFKGEKSH